MADTNAPHILVTGASSALGQAIIRRIADGRNVILAGCHTRCAGLRELAEQIASPLVPIKADLSTPEGIEAFVAAAEAETLTPRAIIHLPAPRLELTRFKDLAWTDFESQMDLQLRSAVGILGRFVPRMAKAGQGRVVVALSSVTLGLPPKAMAHYVTAKHALLGLVLALAAEYADRGVTVNAVSPGMMQTALLDRVPEKILEIAAAQNPMRRIATPEDVAPLVAYLLSPEAAYLTGTNMPVTGGAGV
jgi:3-oxoacyl-[acyl-carrier protein] reductase